AAHVQRDRVRWRSRTKPGSNLGCTWHPRSAFCSNRTRRRRRHRRYVFSSSSLRERLELEALESSSLCRRDSVTGSCATVADWGSAAEDGTSPSSMGTSLMSDP
ncbi:hypothetical protein JG687_00008320, partial [Phytophthora cactorum]